MNRSEFPSCFFFIRPKFFVFIVACLTHVPFQPCKRLPVNFSRDYCSSLYILAGLAGRYSDDWPAIISPSLIRRGVKWPSFRCRKERAHLAGTTNSGASGPGARTFLSAAMYSVQYPRQVRGVLSFPSCCGQECPRSGVVVPARCARKES